MRQTNERRPNWRRAWYGLGLCAAMSLTGCQVDIGGQTLPSPYYQKDDIQYFPAGPEFMLTQEAAVQKEFSEDQNARQR